jgi:enamine deaminase RidA (YjgF/YER057c/UK114 family)
MADRQPGASGRPGRERLNPPGVHTPQANYSLVSRVGDTLYISGQVPVDPAGQVVGKGDPGVQAEQCFRNIETIVKHFGGSLAHVEKLTTYITNWSWRAPVGQVRDRFFGSESPPASTLVVISALASPDFLVEIEAIAVLDG